MKSIEFHTCDVRGGGSEGALSITGTDVDGSEYTVGLTTDDRSRDETNTYLFAAVDLPTTLTINTEGTDAWCIDAVTVDGIAIDMSSCPNGKLWLDQPCSDTTYGTQGSGTMESWEKMGFSGRGIPGEYACLESVTVDVQSGAITNCPKYIEFHTCDLRGADSYGDMSITGTDVNGSEYTVDLEEAQTHTEKRTGGETTCYVLGDLFAAVDQPTTLTINTEGGTHSGNEWCIDGITVDGLEIDMSNLGGGAWLAEPDHASRYACLTYGCVGPSLTLDLTSGTPIIHPRLRR